MIHNQNMINKLKDMKHINMRLKTTLSYIWEEAEKEKSVFVGAKSLFIIVIIINKKDAHQKT